MKTVILISFLSGGMLCLLVWATELIWGGDE